MGLREDKDKTIDNDELSDTWRQLLGTCSINTTSIQAGATRRVTPSSLNVDPWSELLRKQGVEIVDLQHLRLQDIQIAFNDQEVEQALQIMQDQAD